MLASILQSLGSATFFASRAFVPAFVTALLLRIGPSLPWLEDQDLMQALPEAPHWFTSWASIGVLGLLSAVEMLSDKNSDARHALDEFGRFVKPIMAVLTALGLAGALDGDFAKQVLEGGVQPKHGDLGAGLLATVTGVATFLLVGLRAVVFDLFREGDEDDDAGVQGLMSWAEDMTSDRAMKPVQSSAVEPRCVCSRSANQMKAIAARPGGTSMKKAIRQP